MRNDNKLIAEFMSGDFKVNAHYGINIDFLKDNITAKQLENDLRYDKSWDWLMPVVQKCFDTQQPEEGQHYFINESLLTMDIEVVYDRVVEFIKQYNESNKMDNLPPHVQ